MIDEFSAKTLGLSYALRIESLDIEHMKEKVPESTLANVLAEFDELTEHEKLSIIFQSAQDRANGENALWHISSVEQIKFKIWLFRYLIIISTVVIMVSSLLAVINPSLANNLPSWLSTIKEIAIVYFE